MSLELKDIKLNFKKVGFFRFKKLDGNYLLTNDIGFYIFLAPAQFKNFLAGRLDSKSEVYKELEEKGFAKNISRSQKAKLIDSYRLKNSSLFKPGPSLHIVVSTLRCNFKCVYCQVSSKPLKEKKYDMNLDTAKEAVDFIFNAPAPSVGIEFQGGEPLLNWPVVKFIIKYARARNRSEGKKLGIVLVSNLSLMDKKKLDFLIKNQVGICTSLDGPEKIHNKNRPWVGGNSYQVTTKWIKKIQKRISALSKKKRSYPRLGALVTVSRRSLQCPEKIVKEYLKWGFEGLHFRPLTYLGFAKSSRGKIGYSAEEFINAWEKTIDYIIAVNKKGKFFHERGARIMLQKILTDKDHGYTDLKSPCGAVIGQIVYNYDGNIYTCDEGRMLGDDTFLIGNLKKSNYQETIFNNKVKTMVTSSCLENTACDYCVYKPYCGVCPVRNYAFYGNLFPQTRNTDWCKIKIAQFNYLFRKMQDRKIKEIFEKWVGDRPPHVI
jgi:His-Xaa-Ser system radical SAM maturase HxsB